MASPDMQRIYHIRNYCDKIAATIERYGNDFEIFSVDGDYFDSVSMKLMQIGELSVGLSDEFRAETQGEIQWQAIRGMRNFFAHSYRKMNKQTIWEAATQDVPELLAFCNRKLEQAEIQQPQRKEQEQKPPDGPEMKMN
jgi:uncharacterized protein with HEPN domain